MALRRSRRLHLLLLNPSASESSNQVTPAQFYSPDSFPVARHQSPAATSCTHLLLSPCPSLPARAVARDGARAKRAEQAALAHTCSHQSLRYASVAGGCSGCAGCARRKASAWAKSSGANERTPGGSVALRVAQRSRDHPEPHLRCPMRPDQNALRRGKVVMGRPCRGQTGENSLCLFTCAHPHQNRMISIMSLVSWVGLAPSAANLGTIRVDLEAEETALLTI